MKAAHTPMPKVSAPPGAVVELDPSCIYFTFSRIRPQFSCGRTIQSTLDQLLANELQPSDLPLLSVLTDGAHYYSQNNRRLYTYKKLQALGKIENIPVRLRPLPQTKRMKEKYTVEKCSLTATLMREGKKGSPSAAAGAFSQEKEEEEEHDDGEEAAVVRLVSDTDANAVRGSPSSLGTRGGGVCPRRVSKSDADGLSTSSLQRSVITTAHGSTPERNATNVGPSARRHKKAGGGRKRQQGHRGRRSRSSSSSEGGRNSLERELRQLGLH